MEKRDKNLVLIDIILGIFIFIGIFIFGVFLALLVKTAERHEYRTENGTICNIDLKVRVNKVDDKLDIINYRVVECL